MELLKTKLFMPPVPSEMVHRPRLVERLLDGFKGKLTLVSAPPGFGKTTLLSECFSLSDLPVGWVSLDDDDNDPSRFWTYFISALQQIHPEVGESAMEMLESPQPPALETLLTELINDLATAAILSATSVWWFSTTTTLSMTNRFRRAWHFSLTACPGNCTWSSPPESIRRCPWLACVPAGS